MDANLGVGAAMAVPTNAIGLPQAGAWLAHLRSMYATDRAGLESAVAERLFIAHNRRAGALYPYGFGFLSVDDRVPWLEHGRRILAADEARS